jgi:hypothetical protein
MMVSLMNNQNTEKLGNMAMRDSEVGECGLVIMMDDDDTPIKWHTKGRIIEQSNVLIISRQ